jgi:hypothetical protein
VLDLQKRGINIVSFSLADSEDDVTTQLKGINVLIVCYVLDEVVLANAAKKAGVKCYVPCFYGPVMPRGVQMLRNNISGSHFLTLLTTMHYFDFK